MSQLEKYTSNLGLSFVKEWLYPYEVLLVFTRSRKSKLGDYRLSPGQSTHRISVNTDTSPDLLFFTLTHEIAHLIAYDKFGLKINPHGKEWKLMFGKLLMESVDVYSEDFKPLVVRHALNPKASFHADGLLSEYFIRKRNPTSLLLKDLKEGDEFAYNGKKYKYLEKRKSRYICGNTDTGKRYLISGNISVDNLEK